MQQRSCKPRGATGSRRGAAAVVEFAAVVSILVLLMLGLFELSRGMMVRQLLSCAARKGCRTGILHQYGNQDITNDATNIMRDNNFDATKFNPPSIGSITITGTSAQDRSWRNRRINSAPSRSGILKSVMTRSGGLSRA